MTRKKTTQRPQHHRRLLTRLLPALPLSHSPRPATRSKSSHPDEARRTSLRVWRTPIPVTTSCLAPRAVHQAARRRRKRMPPRMIVTMIGSRGMLVGCLYAPCVCQLLAIMMEKSNFGSLLAKSCFRFLSLKAAASRWEGCFNLHVRRVESHHYHRNRRRRPVPIC